MLSPLRGLDGLDSRGTDDNRQGTGQKQAQKPTKTYVRAAKGPLAEARQALEVGRAHAARFLATKVTVFETGFLGLIKTAACWWPGCTCCYRWPPR